MRKVEGPRTAARRALRRGAPRLVAAGLLAATASTVSAEPLPPPALVHVELTDGKHTIDHAVMLGPDGDGVVKLAAPNESTDVHLRLLRRQGAPMLDFEVSHGGPDHSTYTTRGEIAPPRPGQRVLVARVPQPGGSVDVLLSIAPPPGPADGAAANPSNARP